MGNCLHSVGKRFENPQSRSKSVPVSKVNGSEIKNGRLAIALYPLQTETIAILDFSKGDKFLIEDESDPDWYLATHIKSNSRGYAPKSYLVSDVGIGREEWFFADITRADAARLLLQPLNKAGTFLVRHSHIEGTYALSIKEQNSQTNEISVKHYKIRTLDNGGFFISTNVTFSSLVELVSYYSESSNGLCCKLLQACPRPRPVIAGPLPDAKDEYEIPFESLRFDRLVGKGNFGEVFYGFWQETLEVAIKRLKSDGAWRHMEEFRREVSVMKAIHHHKIVRLYAICTEKEPYCIIMEYLCNGNLQQYLKSAHGTQLRLPSLVNISAQIADGMTYLESNNLIHRDLAARNILVGEGDLVKLADFGLARMMDEAIYVTTGGKLPIRWTAPEAFQEGKFTIKSDVWSFGIVLYEIFTHGEMPYEGMKNPEVSHLITKENYRMPKPKDPECTDAVYEVMLTCWRKEPENRPTFDYLHHYFEDYSVTSEASYKEADS